MRRVARTDDNQTEIVEALRSIGASVTPTHQLGGGFPDIVVGYKGVNYLFEIKDGSKPPSARKLTADERKWFESWCGSAHVVESVTEALSIIGIKNVDNDG